MHWDSKQHESCSQNALRTTYIFSSEQCVKAQLDIIVCLHNKLSSSQAPKYCAWQTQCFSLSGLSDEMEFQLMQHHSRHKKDTQWPNVALFLAF